METHQLKTWRSYFRRIVSGEKRFELRKDDRDINVRDLLILSEFDEETNLYLPGTIVAKVTYILRSVEFSEAEKFGLKAGYCIIGFEVIHMDRVS